MPSSFSARRRLLLKFIAGAPSLLLIPPLASLGLTGCSGESDSDSSPGIPKQVSSAEEASALVLSMARLAAAQGTFGVGGAIIDNRNGKVVKALHNKVIQPLGGGLGSFSNTGYTSDPTAHGERQLVSWYFDNRRALHLPEPDQLTIITSLDPCAMCAGSLITAGFNVAVVAYDDYAGVNWNMRCDYPYYPAPIRDRLTRTFGYYGVEDVRPYAGADGILFSETAVSRATAEGCLEVFGQSVEAARQASSSSGLDPRNPSDQMVDPALSAIRLAYQAGFTDAFSIKLTHYRRPDHILKNYLTALKQQTPGARNAVALIDYYGNLLMASADRFDISPISTAFMNTIQDYSKLRFKLINNPGTSADARQSLTNPKYGTFVFLHALDGYDPNSLKDLGAYGSTMEDRIPEPTPSNFQYYEDPLVGSAADFHALVNALPPFYKNVVGVNPLRAG
jgi:tRNA(Arg) A34 adenosine deaminase TadA